MTIFGESRLGRVGYAILILLMLGFDFAKQPIERYIVGVQDAVSEQLLAPRKVETPTPSEIGKVSGKDMPFMLKAHEDIVRDLAKSGRKMSRAEMEALIRKRLDEAGPVSAMPFVTNQPVSSEVKQLVNKRSQLEGLYFVAVIGMTAATIIGLLWMVSSRLRDIGWPQYYLWILIGPVFLPKFLEMPLAPIAAQGLNLMFHAGVVLLALIPGEDDSPTPLAVPVTVRDAAVKRRPGQFGNRGSS